ncbi:Txe/YoeB family addiction module toxin [Pedobacter nyackensis]|uniref:Txe/YoeB family addiction module toxin n=1 Tax=Pedobacter nyackensis TaxID=475255 RepID=UPI00292D817D|nr:Txe/YoeB family addiction module toxin [Pedobacter nyackensis]
MEIIYSQQAQSDIKFWLKSGNKKIQTKITQLINAIQNDPFNGIDKPEALKYEMNGKWSRRIDEGHRLIYEIPEDQSVIKIHSLKGHYR